MATETTKAPTMLLVVIRISGARARDCRKFAKAAADAVEAAFEEQHPHQHVAYDLNLTRWEPL